jgi:hypothetical protein
MMTFPIYGKIKKCSKPPTRKRTESILKFFFGKCPLQNCCPVRPCQWPCSSTKPLPTALNRSVRHLTNAARRCKNRFVKLVLKWFRLKFYRFICLAYQWHCLTLIVMYLLCFFLWRTSFDTKPIARAIRAHVARSLSPGFPSRFSLCHM